MNRNYDNVFVMGYFHILQQEMKEKIFIVRRGLMLYFNWFIN